MTQNELNRYPRGAVLYYAKLGVYSSELRLRAYAAVIPAVVDRRRGSHYMHAELQGGKLLRPTMLSRLFATPEQARKCCKQLAESLAQSCNKITEGL